MLRKTGIEAGGLLAGDPWGSDAGSADRDRSGLAGEGWEHGGSPPGPAGSAGDGGEGDPLVSSSMARGRAGPLEVRTLGPSRDDGGSLVESV